MSTLTVARYRGRDHVALLDSRVGEVREIPVIGRWTAHLVGGDELPGTFATREAAAEALALEWLLRQPAHGEN